MVIYLTYKNYILIEQFLSLHLIIEISADSQSHRPCFFRAREERPNIKFGIFLLAFSKKKTKNLGKHINWHQSCLFHLEVITEILTTTEKMFELWKLTSNWFYGCVEIYKGPR